jgi:DNA invertase Pin-like site-specific DNA recombinase
LLQPREHLPLQLGIPPERIYVDKKSGSTTDRPGLRALLGYAREGEVIVVHTLDRLGRTVRDTLNLIHELAEHGIGVRNLADPIRIDSRARDDPMAQLAVVLLALFGQMERTYAIERAAHARAVATRERPTGRSARLVDVHKLAWAEHLRDAGNTIAFRQAPPYKSISCRKVLHSGATTPEPPPATAHNPEVG